MSKFEHVQEGAKGEGLYTGEAGLGPSIKGGLGPGPYIGGGRMLYSGDLLGNKMTDRHDKNITFLQICWQVVIISTITLPTRI